MPERLRVVEFSLRLSPSDFPPIFPSISSFLLPHSTAQQPNRVYVSPIPVVCIQQRHAWPRPRQAQHRDDAHKSIILKRKCLILFYNCRVGRWVLLWRRCRQWKATVACGNEENAPLGFTIWKVRTLRMDGVGRWLGSALRHGNGIRRHFIILCNFILCSLRYECAWAVADAFAYVVVCCRKIYCQRWMFLNWLNERGSVYCRLLICECRATHKKVGWLIWKACAGHRFKWKFPVW